MCKCIEDKLTPRIFQEGKTTSSSYKQFHLAGFVLKKFIVVNLWIHLKNLKLLVNYRFLVTYFAMHEWNTEVII